MYRTSDRSAQHRILNHVAARVDAGVLRTTASHVLHPLNAAHLIEAPRLVEHGGVTGKVVVARTLEDTQPRAGKTAR